MAAAQRPAWERRGALHFVGFKDERLWNAVKVWGRPDFYHRHWDDRARAEIVDGDVAIFASGSIDDTPTPFAFNDSERF
jgi:hypothetical protein